MKLSCEQNKIHQYALDLSRKHRDIEAEILDVLHEVERTKLYRLLDKSSLFTYTVSILGFTESVAYTFITVSRKAAEIPELKLAIERHALTVSKASRIVSSLSAQNASEWINFACHHTCREIDQERARRNPKSPGPDKCKAISEDLFEVTMTMSRKGLEKLKRAQTLRAQRQLSSAQGEKTEEALDFMLQRKDPVEKAKRARANSARRESARKKSAQTEPNLRRSLTAAQKHAVFLRDEGRCTHVGSDGKRCNNDKWIEIHHIKSVSEGGSNDPTNLTTLCSFHHDLVHQLTLPLEGQVTWLRSVQVAYQAFSAR